MKYQAKLLEIRGSNPKTYMLQFTVNEQPDFSKRMSVNGYKLYKDRASAKRAKTLYERQNNWEGRK